jgi:sugar phosphate isomerase/epimerase
MQFGAMNFPITPVLDEIDIVARLGFDYLELAMDPPMAHHSILSASRTSILSALKADGLGLICHLPTFVSTADLTESLRQASVTEMRRSLDVAVDLGAMKVVLHPSRVAGMGAFVMDEVKSHAFAFLEQIATDAQSLDVTICVENMFPRHRLGVEPEDFEEIFTSFPSLQLTLDTGHANIEDPRGRRLNALAVRFGERIGHIHISDNRGKRDDHLAVGQGTVDFPRLVRHLRAIGYNDSITLEIFDQNRRMLVESRQRIVAMFLGQS